MVGGVMARGFSITKMYQYIIGRVEIYQNNYRVRVLP